MPRCFCIPLVHFLWIFRFEKDPAQPDDAFFRFTHPISSLPCLRVNLASRFSISDVIFCSSPHLLCLRGRFAFFPITATRRSRAIAAISSSSKIPWYRTPGSPSAPRRSAPASASHRRRLSLPPGIRHHILHRHSGMKRCKIRFAIAAKTQHALRGDHRRRPPARQPHALAPSRAFAVPRTGNVAHLLRQPVLAMLQQDTKRCAIDAISHAPPEPGSRTMPFLPALYLR